MRIALIMPGRGQIHGRLQDLPEESSRPGRPWMPPGSLLEVAGMTPKDYQVVIWDELARGPLTEKNLPEADLYGLSGLSTSRYGAFRAADLIRRCGKKVVAGGMDVTGHFSEGHGQELLGHYDSVVVGRLTSRLWARVLADFAKGRLEQVYQADPSEPWEFAIPRHDLLNPKDYFLPAVIRSSAGCNQGCPFCTVHLVIGGRTIYCKPANILEQELSLLPRSRYLVDSSDSFGTDYRHTIDVVLPLLRDQGRPWFTEITIKNLLGIDGDRERLIEPMAQNGCAGVYLGIENINERVSRKSLSQELTEEAISRSHDAGFLVLGSFILDVTGNETRESIERTVEWGIEQKLDFAQFSLLALLPGSISRRIALNQGRVIDNNPEHLDGAWPTIEHPMSVKERIERLHWAYRETYSLANIRQRLVGLSHTHLGRRALVAAANIQIHRSSARWERNAGYDYWLATREHVS